jgi:hypothetical protein
VCFITAAGCGLGPEAAECAVPEKKQAAKRDLRGMIFAAPSWFYKFGPWAYGPPAIGKRDIAKEDAPSLLRTFRAVCVTGHNLPISRLAFPLFLCVCHCELLLWVTK